MLAESNPMLVSWLALLQVAAQSSPNDRPISIDCKWANDREEVDDLRVDCEIAGRSLGKH